MRRARRARSYTCWIIGFPWMSERGFPGRRVEPKRAGMIATMANTLWALVYAASYRGRTHEVNYARRACAEGRTRAAERRVRSPFDRPRRAPAHCDERKRGQAS